MVDLRIELNATRLSAAGFFLWLTRGQPALDYRRSLKLEVRSVNYFKLQTSQFKLLKWTCRELNPEALSASQSADPSASP